MGLFSIFKRTGASTDAGAGAVDTVDAVQQARMRARRRLIGAVVLLVIGVIGFPLVFETRPRPIPIDIPIEIPKRESAAPLVMPPAHQAPMNSASKPAVAVARGNAEMTAEASSDAPRESARPAPSASSAASGARAVVRTASPASAPIVEVRKPAPTAHAAPEAARAVTSVQASAPIGRDGAKAKALLEAKPAATTADGRYVVQVGAFAEAGSARETRMKAEKLGLKTYTQVAQTGSGSRIRVRIGPFANRAEADAASAKARAAGLAAVVLTL